MSDLVTYRDGDASITIEIFYDGEQRVFRFAGHVVIKNKKGIRTQKFVSEKFYASRVDAEHDARKMAKAIHNG